MAPILLAFEHTCRGPGTEPVDHANGWLTDTPCECPQTPKLWALHRNRQNLYPMDTHDHVDFLTKRHNARPRISLAHYLINVVAVTRMSATFPLGGHIEPPRMARAWPSRSSWALAWTQPRPAGTAYEPSRSGGVRCATTCKIFQRRTSRDLLSVFHKTAGSCRLSLRLHQSA